MRKKIGFYAFLLIHLFGFSSLSPSIQNRDRQPPEGFFAAVGILKSTQINSLFNGPLLLVSNPLIERFKKQYTTEGGLRYLSSIMQRSSPYRNFIIEELAQANLPPELLFLPVIESGFSEKAVSKSGAVGIWQFMRNSIGGYDIHINDWMDERRDPWKTSIAAIKKLKWNYEQLRDWPLALAAYNCGMGAINKAIKKAGQADYWYLCEKGFLKRETVLYVPKFLAIAEILSRSSEYGIDWGDPTIHPETTTITVKRAIDVVMLAEKIGADANDLKKINPSLKHAITPPNTKYPLRIPVAYEQATKQLLNNKSSILIKYYLYKIRSGDTLYALANHYGVSVDSIINYNKGLKPSALRLGQTIVIPALKTVHEYRGKNPSENIDFSGKYVVRKGDTLWSIALAYNVQVETLAEKNKLSVNSILSLGKVLNVPIQ
ncbi:LysM peptidoglycan-binding domain-containing protein [Treponema phagedenis]|uniref:LysM domain protein n=1 Tax=Treponema phagedenis TaxID=162 RepID=A0A0B7GWC3_TREPH|nr:lytic transglycosylase domain-containing protein [Treponema phagedenis]QEJ95244.1 LysM peptidoglycan-binding domain-containing protein [Treponema phagedenis]QEJ98080.1 LysM peptidoglycan-binding domain-containing protein [Treponema phagedenis]QEK01098.1 LysM peptidoglycan-binding domain-containing protein [Treponema phagedenis]QEK03585.1 LysM peptidoglycan-binding domain-containing protein [Treponema phagedenis]QEK06106.1 LysM peptidoglycan-binding domain-containing protein [Treponema phage